MNWLPIKVPLLSLVDFINSAAEPWDKFDRPVQLAPGSEGTPEEILAKLYSAKSAEIGKWTVLDGKIFLQSIPNDLGDACIWQGVYTAWAVLSKASVADRAVIGLSEMIDSQGRLRRGHAPPWASAVDPNNLADYAVTEDTCSRYGASLDSLAGFLFGAAVVHRFGTEYQKSLLAPSVELFAKTFKDNDHSLIGLDNKVTKHGDCSVKFLQAPVRNLAGCLGDRFISFDGSTYTDWKNLVKNYKHEFSRLETHFLWKHGRYNDNLAVLLAAAFCLAVNENDPGHKEARKGLEILAEKHKESGNSFFAYAASICGVNISDDQRGKADKTLLEFRLEGSPDGKKPAKVTNSTDPNVKKVKWGKETFAAQPIPVWKRPPADFLWQRNPYPLDSGLGEHEYPCLDYLIAYVLRSRT